MGRKIGKTSQLGIKKQVTLTSCLRVGGGDSVSKTVPCRRPEGTQKSVFDDDNNSNVDAVYESHDAPATKGAGDKKKRNLDLFLEEIKRGQEQREHRVCRREENEQGFRSSAVPSEGDDGITTNLHVSNLHPKVDERALCLAFAKYGPIASLKIMWPRAPDEHSRQRKNGFVSFMDRECAVKAIRAMDGEELNGHKLRVVWGMRVPIPSRPVFVLEESDPQLLPPTGHPFNAKRPIQTGGIFANTAATGRNSDDDAILEVQVERPLDQRLVRLIHWTVEHVIKHGPEFECLLISKTLTDARFRFLTDHRLPEHVYYRWRMYSLLNGDTKRKWRDDMFFMYDRGPIWISPKVRHDVQCLGNSASAELLSSEAEERVERGRDELGRRARDRLERRVRRVCRPEHGVIAEAMAFAVEHAYAAKEVVDVVCCSLLDASASPTDKLCKLMLISDILHNSSAQVANAWRLRQAFEERLSQLFADLAVAYKAIEARLKAEHFRKQVLAVLAVWEAWMMFPQETICRLAAEFVQ
ncbi:hypothetical protein GGI20_004502 [Coemansia sp. BCRC 34301]|nr:hypothetical protein GGI20_004502 [Coemansia sp. BCRC 34301]